MSDTQYLKNSNGTSMQLIALSGVDGSGKSTQTKLLKSSLEGQGKKVAYFHATEFSLANRLHRFLKAERKDFVPGTEKAVTRATRLSVFLREVFLFIDMLRFKWYREELERKGVDYILSDRFFYDSLINLAYLKGGTSTHSWLEAFLPKADSGFYFSLPPEAIMARERVPEQGQEYLRTKMTLFQDKIADWNMISLDANRPQEEILQDIRQRIQD